MTQNSPQSETLPVRLRFGFFVVVVCLFPFPPWQPLAYTYFFSLEF